MASFSWSRFVRTNNKRKRVSRAARMEALESRLLLTADLSMIVEDISPDSELGDDQHSDEIGEDATVVKLDGTPLYSNIDIAGDVDVFQFTPEMDGTVTLVGGTVFESDMDEDHEECAPDSEVGEDPHGDTIEDATELEFEDGWASVWSHIDTTDDVDVFSFTADSDTTLSVYAYNATEFMADDIEFEVLNADGELVGEVDDFGNGSVEVVEDGEYFVRVNSSSEGASEYIFQIVDCPGHEGGFGFETDSELGDDPHSDIADETATEITPTEGTYVNSYIDEAGDVDVFRFTAEDDANLSLSVWMSDAQDMFENAATVELLDASGEVLDQTDGTWVPLATEVEAGEDYFVRVSADDDATGQYSMSAVEFSSDVFMFVGEVSDFDWGEWDSSEFDWGYSDSDWDWSSDVEWSDTEFSWGDDFAWSFDDAEFDMDFDFDGEGVDFEIIDADGEVVSSMDEDGLLTADVTAEQTYYVRVNGTEEDFTGTYVADLAFDSVEMEEMELEIPDTEEKVVVTVKEDKVVMKVGDEVVERMDLDDTEKLMIVGTNSSDNVVINIKDASDELEMIEVDANKGNDRIRVKAKEDAFNGDVRIEGDKGRDRLIAKESEIPVEMHGGRGNDILTGSQLNDILCGDEGQDEIRGRGGKDFLEGGDGDDILKGGSGNDMLSGGLGEDMIDGQGGRDTLTESFDQDVVLTSSSLEVADATDELFRIERTFMDGEGEVDTTSFAGRVAGENMFNRLMDELFA